MTKIKILVVIDSFGALSSAAIENNVYMIDTNRWLGSWQEGLASSKQWQKMGS